MKQKTHLADGNETVQIMMINIALPGLWTSEYLIRRKVQTDMINTVFRELSASEYLIGKLVGLKLWSSVSMMFNE